MKPGETGGARENQGGPGRARESQGEPGQAGEPWKPREPSGLLCKLSSSLVI